MIRTLTFTENELEDLLVRAARLGAEQFYKQAQDPFRDTPLTKQQAAEYLDVSVATIDRWMKQGLPFEKRTPNAHPKFFKSQIDRWRTMFTNDIAVSE